jgi:hypothetical protein
VFNGHPALCDDLHKSGAHRGKHRDRAGVANRNCRSDGLVSYINNVQFLKGLVIDADA